MHTFSLQKFSSPWRSHEHNSFIYMNAFLCFHHFFSMKILYFFRTCNNLLWGESNILPPKISLDVLYWLRDKWSSTHLQTSPRKRSLHIYKYFIQAPTCTSYILSLKYFIDKQSFNSVGLVSLPIWFIKPSI